MGTSCWPPISLDSRQAQADGSRAAAHKSDDLYSRRCVMLSQPITPAAQLSSACERYAGPWANLTNRQEAAACRTSPVIAAPFAAGNEQPSPPAGDSDVVSRLEAVLLLAREPLTSRKL